MTTGHNDDDDNNNNSNNQDYKDGIVKAVSDGNGGGRE